MAGTIDVSLDNRNHLVTATSGGGKSTWVKRQVRGARRLLVWDPDGEYSGIVQTHTTRSTFIAALRKRCGRSSPMRLGLTVDPTEAAFEWWAAAVFAVACATRPMVVVAEEIADVTRTAKASTAWGQLVRRGRKYGVQLFAVTQRPAECDKTIYSQTAYKWVGVLESEADRKRLASLIGIRPEVLAELKPLECYYKRPGAPAEFGRVRIRSARPGAR